MKKYIRVGICLIYSFIKFSFIKLFHIKDVQFTILNIVSPFTEIEVGKKAKLSLGKMIRIRSGSKVRVRNGAVIQIGENTSLNHGCMVISHEKIIIGRDVQFGPNVFIYDHDHDFRVENGLKELKYKTSPVIIRDNVWIGASSVVLKGVEIGEGSVIAAGTIVTKDIPPNSIAYNNKKLIIKKI